MFLSSGFCLVVALVARVFFFFFGVSDYSVLPRRPPPPEVPEVGLYCDSLAVNEMSVHAADSCLRAASGVEQKILRGGIIIIARYNLIIYSTLLYINIAMRNK